MRIDQRNNGAVGSAAAYTIDRWKYVPSVANKISWGRNAGSPSSGPPGFPYWLGFATATSYTPTTSDLFCVQQGIEADMLGDLAWGAAGAQAVTLSFWAYDQLAGTYSGAIRNGDGTRSYPFTFPLAAGVWTKCAITIPGDTGGTWTLSGNGPGILLTFDLGGGSANRAPANAWVSGNFVGASGAANPVAALGTFAVTGVKLEIGSVATPYNRQSLAKSMADCQRYYQQAPSIYNFGAGVNGAQFNMSWPTRVTMRASPTLTVNFSQSNGLTSPTIAQVDADSFRVNGAMNTTSYGVIFSFTASAEL